MARLDYRRNNARRRGVGGLNFQNWQDFSYILGFLSNINHFRRQSSNGVSSFSNSIEICVEQNDENGAWGREGRIHYYLPLNTLQQNFPTLNVASSAGNGNITRRINCLQYIRDLVSDFNFLRIAPQNGQITERIIPPTVDMPQTVENRLRDVLIQNNLLQNDINTCISAFTDGWNL
ncbi:hypothetical protein J6N69_00675 [bacterium]|nr:hypothetical protein [bacterium]